MFKQKNPVFPGLFFYVVPSIRKGLSRSNVTQLQVGRKPVVRQTGFVAQEVEAIIKKGKYSFNAVNAPQNEQDHYSIRYAEFVVPLVKAVQELTAKMEAQDKEIKALKKQLGTTNTSMDSAVDDGLNRSGAALYQNNPNPFSIETDIDVSLPDDITHANLILYTMEGKQLKVIPIDNRGDLSIKIQGNELHAGMYMYALMADGKIVDSKRLVITGN